MLVLLSPSKTQDFSAHPLAVTPTQPELLEESALLLKELRALSPQHIGKLMAISEKLSALNHQRFQDFSLPFTPQNAKPAALAFKGDVYDGLDALNLTTDDLQFAQHSLRILSSFYGVLRPLDLIQAYRLEMKTPLANPRGKDLYRFWGDRLTNLLNRQLQEEKTDTIVNLASQEYFAAINRKNLQGQLVTVHFKERKDGALKVVGLFAKRARGMMARHIIRQRITDIRDITGFDDAGYAFEPELSDDAEFVFARTTPRR